jgi:hypothetical protein
MSSKNSKKKAPASKDEMAANKSTAGRKNKAFQMLKRDMEQRSRQKKRGAQNETSADKEVVRDVIYIDRDRAAAVAIGGNKDIKSDLKVKKLELNM